MIDALNLIRPKVKSATIQKYFMMWLEDWRNQYNSKMEATGFKDQASPINKNDQMERMLDESEFVQFAMDFSSAFDSNRAAWRKRIARNGGRKGGLKTQKKRVLKEK